MSDKEIVTKYDTFTIDTNVVYSNNDGKLFYGLLNKFDQYKDGPAKFILSEIVFRELHKKLNDKANKNKSRLNTLIGDFEGVGMLSEADITSIKALYKELKSPSEHAEQSLKKFIELSGAEIISADNLDIQNLLNLYFECRPPFEKNKKNEFPDAIALISLEKWAEKYNKKIAAVTNDSDWHKFAKDSEFIDAFNSLSEVMAMLVNAKDTLPEAQRLFDAVNKIETAEYFEFQEELVSAVSWLEPDFEFDGNVYYEEVGQYIELVNYEILVPDDQLLEENIVSITPQEFAFEIPVKLNVNVSAFLKGSIKDSIDKDYIGLGEIEVERSEEIDAKILITCLEGEVTEDNEEVISKYFIDKVELLHTPISIDLGYVEFEFPDIDYEFERNTGR